MIKKIVGKLLFYGVNYRTVWFAIIKMKHTYREMVRYEDGEHKHFDTITYLYPVGSGELEKLKTAIRSRTQAPESTPKGAEIYIDRIAVKKNTAYLWADIEAASAEGAHIILGDLMREAMSIANVTTTSIWMQIAEKGMYE